MNARDRWQALQTRLTAARSFQAAGDRRSALREVDAALQLDPNFLAAHSLREQLLSESPTPSEHCIQASRGDGYAMFEQRARRRRVDRKLESARAALAGRRLRDAASALDEIIELDPNLPELSSLTAQFDDLRRGRAAGRHRGPLVVAAASFALVVGATWLEHARPILLARPTTAVASLVEPPPPAPVEAPQPIETDSAEPAPSEPAPMATAATSGVRADEPARPAIAERDRPARSVEPRPEPVNVRSADATAEPRVAAASAPLESSIAPPAAASLPGARQAPEPITIPPVLQPVNSTALAAAPAAVARSAGDEQLVRQALQRYRSAYEGLDAPSAARVYPAVNEAALARAFDGLQSQTITFDSCDVQMRGETATAKCRGSARYVPKVGSREPRTEARTWTFALRRAGSDWTIENARAER